MRVINGPLVQDGRLARAPVVMTGIIRQAHAHSLAGAVDARAARPADAVRVLDSIAAV